MAITCLANKNKTRTSTSVFLKETLSGNIHLLSAGRCEFFGDFGFAGGRDFFVFGA